MRIGKVVAKGQPQRRACARRAQAQGVSNRKKQGTARVHVRFQKEAWDLGLAPGARAAVELYARWPAGTPFRKGKNRPADETPTVELNPVGSIPADRRGWVRMESNRSKAFSMNRVRELRENRLMTQAQLARKAKVALRTIHSVEKGMNCRMDTKRKT